LWRCWWGLLLGGKIFMYICIWIRTYICIKAYMWVHIHINVFVHTNIHVHIHTCMYIYMYICSHTDITTHTNSFCTCTRKYMYVHKYTYVHICIHVYIYVHMYIFVHIRIPLWFVMILIRQGLNYIKHCEFQSIIETTPPIGDCNNKTHPPPFSFKFVGPWTVKIASGSVG